MADPRAFVSFDFDHNETQKNLFVGQATKDSPVSIHSAGLVLQEFPPTGDVGG